jgi:hypothetical protein
MSVTTEPAPPRSPRQRRIATVAIVISLGIVGVAQRDLHRRSAEEVRGRRWIWRIVNANALGVLAYFRWGRSTPTPSG